MSRTLVSLVVALLLATASAFVVPTTLRTATSLRMGEVYYDNNCDARLKDKNERCPGMPGYQPTVPVDSVPSNSFADFQKAMAEKKRAAKDAKGLKK